MGNDETVTSIILARLERIEGKLDIMQTTGCAKAEASAKKIKGPKRNGKGGREFPVMFDIASRAQKRKGKKDGKK